MEGAVYCVWWVVGAVSYVWWVVGAVSYVWWVVGGVSPNLDPVETWRHSWHRNDDSYGDMGILLAACATLAQSVETLAL